MIRSFYTIALLLVSPAVFAFLSSPASLSLFSRFRCVKDAKLGGSCSRSERFRLNMNDKVTFSVVPSTKSSVNISVSIPGSLTQKAYQDSLRELSKKQKIPGFTTGGSNKRVPDQVLLNYYGEELVKGSTLENLTDTAVKKAIEEAGIKAIGQAELVEKAETLLTILTPGEPLQLSVRVDVWPKVTFTGPYTGFTISAECAPIDTSQYDATIQRLKERAVATVTAPDDHSATRGDSVIVDMHPFEVLEDGTRGEALPNLAGGDDVEIILETERFMPGLIEGLMGVKRGEVREIPVKFPEKLGGAATVLQGKNAVFEVTCKDILIRTLPELNDEFAASIRPGLTMEGLRDEVLTALNSEGDKKKAESRDKALEMALLKRVDVEIPETLLIEQARQKFAIMMADMKNQGQKDDEELRKMITPENFNKYKEVVRESTTRQLKLSLALSEIAELEGLEVDQNDVDDQMELIRAEAKGEEFDEGAAKERVEATLQKNLVLEWIAARSTIEFTEVVPEPVIA